MSPRADLAPGALQPELLVWMELTIGAIILTVEFAGAQASVVRLCRREAMRVWVGCAPVAVGTPDGRADVRCVSAYTRSLRERDAAVRTVLSDLSREVTRFLVGRQASCRLLLHAAALPRLGGARCSALIGASGAGKTTFVQTHAHSGYLTDELVAVDHAGMVSPYRKPLSIVAGGSVKDQRPPTMLAGGPQQLDALVLLDRVETGEVTATRLDLVDSMAALVPHTSGLSSLPRPLHRLARLIADCGGAIRLRYSEAAEVDLATVIARCAKRTLPWSDVVDDMQDDRAQAPSGAMVRAEYTDAIEAGGDLTVFAGDRLLRLSPVAATVWRLCAIATTPDAIAPKLGLAPDIVREVASELIDRDLLRYAARVEPDRSGPTPPLPPC